jgi:hypothetical protein
VPSAPDQLAEALRAAATSDGLRGNPFRLSNARIDSSPRDLNRAFNLLKVQVELGDLPGHSYGPKSADGDDVRQASERVKDPVKRLADECFWFWPLELGEKDSALEAIAAGNPGEPIAIWQQMSPHATWGPIAKHNLALVALLDAIEKTEAFLRKTGTTPRPESLGAAWIETANNFGALTDSLPVEDYLRARIRSLEDPRLSPRDAANVQLALPEAVARQAAQAALALHEADCFACRTVAFCAEKLAGSAVADIVGDLLRGELEQMLQFGQKPPEGDPRSLWKEPVERLRRLCGKLELFEACKTRRADLANTCGSRLRGYAVECANDHDDYAQSSEILNALLPLVSGEELKKVKADLVTVKGLLKESELNRPVQGLLTKINALHAEVTGSLRTKASGRQAVDVLLQRGRDLLAEINALTPPTTPLVSSDKARERLAAVFQDISLETNNQLKDYGAAYLFCEFALSFATGKLKEKLQAGITTIRQNYDLALEEKHGAYAGTHVNDSGERLTRGFKFAAGGAMIGGLVGQHLAGALLGGLVGGIAGYNYRP